MIEGKDKTLRACRDVRKTTQCSESGKKPLRPAQCRGHVRRELASNFEEIVTGLVEKAKAGSIQHIRLATELLEVGPQKKEKPGRKGPGTLTRVLQEIERRKSERNRGAIKIQ